MKVQDVMYVGIGSLLLAKDRFEKELDRIAGKGKEGRAELERFIERARDRAEKEFAGRADEFRTRFRDEVSELGLATKKDLEDLKATLKGA